MKPQIRLTLAFALAIVAGNAAAQRLRLQPLEAFVNEQVELVVTAENVSGMTSLMFTLALPDNIRSSERTPILSEATNNHTVETAMLANGKLLVILYSMNLNTFTDGELLRIPLAMTSEEGNGTARLADVRFSDTYAVSYPADESEAIITGIKGIAPDRPQKAEGNTYTLGGQMVNGQRTTVNRKLPQGIYVEKGKKVLNAWKSKP